MKIELTRDWREFLSLLIARRVRFVLIGGHAVAGHGEPRLTEDLDVFVEPSTRNAKRLREALVDFGFGAVTSRIVDLARADKGCSRRIRRIHRLQTGRSARRSGTLQGLLATSRLLRRSAPRSGAGCEVRDDAVKPSFAGRAEPRARRAPEFAMIRTC